MVPTVGRFGTRFGTWRYRFRTAWQPAGNGRPRTRKGAGGGGGPSPVPPGRGGPAGQGLLSLSGQPISRGRIERRQGAQLSQQGIEAQGQPIATGGAVCGAGVSRHGRG